MKKLKSLGILMLSLLLAFSMSCTALAADDAGSITISNATIGATYHVYKLFDVTIGTSYTDSNGDTVTPTAYTATGSQRDALEAEADNVFDFTAIVESIYTVTYDEDTGMPVEEEVADSEKDELVAELTNNGKYIISTVLTTEGTYQVTVKDGISDDTVIAFVQSYVRTVGSLTACYFPGATEEGSATADTSTVTFSSLPLGYYFVTSSLGTVVSLDTTNTSATIVDKNTTTPDWDNNPDEPDPDDPVKEVLDEGGTRSIDQEKVSVEDVLTYSISYTNNSGELLSEVIVYDAQPDGTTYQTGTIAIDVLDVSGTSVKAEIAMIPTDPADDMVDTTIYYALDDSDADELTWTIKNLPASYTLVATFQVEVTEDAYTLEEWTIVNDADLKVTLGENTYWLKTNTVENPVEDVPGVPEKDVKAGTDDPENDVTTGSIDGNTVSVGDILTYTIEYTNNEKDSTSGEGVSVDLTIKDAPPAGTTYVAGSAGSTMSSITTITVNTDGSITWVIDDLEYGKTVTVYFQVEVTEAALYLVDSTIPNSAEYSFDGTNYSNTNTVKNPVDGPNEPEKDVKEGTSDPSADVETGSIDGNKVDVDDILTYTITYTNDQDAMVDLTITDTPPAGTEYVVNSAASTLASSTTITVDENYNITWVVKNLAVGESVTVYFQVTVTAEALTLTSSSVENSAEYSFNGQNFYETNTVKNPTDDDEPDEPGDFGKVIINADGTESTVSTGAFGDTVTFDVSIDAVNLVADEGRITNDTNTYNDQVAYYYIYDQMDPGFTLMTGSFTLTINNVTYDIISTGTDATSGATTYTFGAGTTTVGTMYTYVNTDADGNTINTLIGVTIYWADADGNGLYPDCEIHLIYTATINENAVIAGSGNLNRAIYDYSVVGHDNPEEPDPEDPKYPSGSDLNHETEERTTVTYTYALGIYKISAETGEALSGAEFTFADAGGNTVYMAATGVDGVYNYCSAGTTDATDTVVSNSDGQIIIKGVDIGTYTLTEVKAPKGYVLLTDPVMLKATMSSSAATTVKSSTTVTRIFDAITESEFAAFAGTVYTKDEDGTFVETEKPADYTSGLYQMVSSSTSTSEDGQTTVTETYAIEATSVTIENAAGISLPSTGGIGTTIFYIIGGILVFGAVVLLITRKRMKKID